MSLNHLRPIEIEMIRSSTARISDIKHKAGQHDRVFSEADDLFQTKRAADWLKLEAGKPDPRKLFGTFWTEHELCILFADTNLGKSILAVQIADSLTKLYCIEPFANELEVSPRVLYLDCEMTGKQFEARYNQDKYKQHHFSENFFRSEFNTAALADVIYYNNYNDFVYQQMELAIDKTKARVLIIDNITYMRSSGGHANDALALMKALKALKNKHGLSILVLAHTPKRNPHKPLTVNDLQGSKMLINFADSAFAIGQSFCHAELVEAHRELVEGHAKACHPEPVEGPELRYLKQIKQRGQRQHYGENNIVLIALQNHYNLLRYQVIGYAREQDHLRRPETANKARLRKKVKDLRAQGLGLREIARQTSLHFTTVGKIVRGK